MEENSGAFEEKKNQKGGKRLMRPDELAGMPEEETVRSGWKIPVILLCALVGLYLAFGAWVAIRQSIYPNTMIGGVDYGGLTQQEAAQKLGDSLERAKSASVSFILPDGTEIASVALGDVRGEIDSDRYADGLYQLYGCTDNFLVAGAKYLYALANPQEVSFSIGGEAESSLKELSQAVCDSIDRDPVAFSAEVTEDGTVSATKPMDGRKVADMYADSRILMMLRSAYLSGGQPAQITLHPVSQEGGVYEVTPAQEVDLAAEREKLVGQKVNAAYDKEMGSITAGHAGVEFSLEDLRAAYDAARPGETFTVKATVELPDVTEAQLEELLFRDELSSYTTKVGGAAGRRKNVKLTASRIDGYILNAGETMKYGPLVTPFTTANGYSPAPGYLQGKTVDMVGGGACQASSTLYAAVLYANLEIVQRINHGFASDYIGLGLDATVAEGGPEFEFRNNTLYPIKVRAEFYTKDKKDYIKVTLLGTKLDDTYVKMRTDVLETIPFSEQIIETDELPAGERRVEQTAYTGYKVKTYRNVYSGDGTLISSTFEASSNYKARDRIVLVGKGSSTTTTTEPSSSAEPTTPESPATPASPDAPSGIPDSPDSPIPTAPATPDAPTDPSAPESEKPEWLDNF